MRWQRRLTVAVLLCVGVVAWACTEAPAAGEWGQLHYFAEMPGRAPMRLFPPIHDESGNLYVLHGDRTRSEALAMVGQSGGGWSDGCRLQKGARGVHGWVGAARNRAWYWAGTALIEIDATGNCRRILDRDPVSSADLRFEGVFPFVRTSPSMTLVMAYVATSSDQTPFWVTIDVPRSHLEDAVAFQPPDATGVEIAGVGAEPDGGALYVLLSYRDATGATLVEGRIMDRRGAVLARARIDGLTQLRRDDVVGFLSAAHGVVAGVLANGQVVIFGSGYGRVVADSELQAIAPVGVHRWGDRLWLVGQRDGRPALAAITRSGLGPAVIWSASERAAENLEDSITVRDERHPPSALVSWAQPTTAIGPAPFVSPFAPSVFAEGTSSWLVAGPSFTTGIEGTTAIAVGAVGISYP